ncbi:MAG: pentapeptide repeat-containing protein [Hyphomicrobiales bacterium]|nr:pentapeptide repeat-containing protein [Hyphomicrobiales bacterium]
MRKERSKALRWKRGIIVRREESIRFWKKLTSWIDEQVTSWWGEQTFGRQVIVCAFIILIIILCILSFIFEHATRNLILLTAGLIGWYFLFRRTKVAEQGLTVERLTHAIEQLTNDNLSVRLGGILGLEQIAETREEERKKIARILVTFIRTHATKDSDEVKRNLIMYKSPNLEATEEFNTYRTLRLDIEAAVNALANIASKLERQGQFRKQYNETKIDLCDLQNIDLRGLRFVEADLSQFNLAGTDMSGAWLAGVKLMGARLYKVGSRNKTVETNLINAFLDDANLSDAHLNYVDFSGTQLVRANFSKARLHGATFSKANLKFANLSGALLANSDFQEADLKNTIFDGAQVRRASFEKCKNLTQKQVDKMSYGKMFAYTGIRDRVGLPKGLEPPPLRKKLPEYEN